MVEAQRKKGRRPKRQREEDEEGATSNGDNNDGSCRELSTTGESTNSVSVAKRNDNVDNPLLNNNQPTFPSINNNDGNNNNENENNNNLPTPQSTNNNEKGELVLDQEDYDDNLICPPAHPC